MLIGYPLSLLVNVYLRILVKILLSGILAITGFHSSFVSAAPESHKHFITESGTSIDSVCVVASYTKISGVGVGPDGKGGKTSVERYLLKPFNYVPTENFFAKLVPNRIILIPIPPGLVFGEGLIPDQVLFLKAGYLPFRRRGDYDAKTETLTLKPDGSKRVEAVIEALLRRDASAEVLQDYFFPYSSEPKGYLVIDYTAEDDELLRTCLSGN